MRSLRDRRSDGGFNLVEVMVVVVIIAILSMIAAPRFTRDRIAAEGREFVNELTRELQRCRIEAVSTRFPIHAFVYSDRVEIRSARPGASLVAPVVAPTTADPILRTIPAKRGIVTYDVTNTTGTPSAALSTTTSKELVFSTMGDGFIGPTRPVNPLPVYIYVENTAAPSNHPERRFRVDVSALTGYVEMKSTW